jgi:hypothetical protein
MTRSGSASPSEPTFAQQVIQPLKKAFTDIADGVKEFSAHVPIPDSEPLERNVHELLIFLDALDEATDMHGLRTRLDDYIHESLGYFHNFWVLRYYLPTVRQLAKHLFDPGVSKVLSEVVTFSSEMTRRFDNYLKLPHFFESTDKKSTIESTLKEAEDAVARTRQKLTFRPKKKEKLSGPLKKFPTFKSDSPLIESCRSVCRAFDRLKTFLWRSVYEGTMSAIYAIPGFRLEIPKAQILAFKHRTDQEQEMAFRLAVPLDRSAGYLQALQNQRANMQAGADKGKEKG